MLLRLHERTLLFTPEVEPWQPISNELSGTHQMQVTPCLSTQFSLRHAPEPFHSSIPVLHSGSLSYIAAA